MEDRNGGAILAIGGVLTVVFLGIWALRFLRALFEELGKTFEAFGNMAASGLSMLGNAALVVALIAVIVGSIIAAVYFTYKYVMLVRRATDIQEMVNRRLYESAHEVQESFRQFRVEVNGQIRYLDRQLTEALKEPDPVPLLQPAKSEPANVVSASSATAESEGSIHATPAAADLEPPVSQPY